MRPLLPPLLLLPLLLLAAPPALPGAAAAKKGTNKKAKAARRRGGAGLTEGEAAACGEVSFLFDGLGCERFLAAVSASPARHRTPACTPRTPPPRTQLTRADGAGSTGRPRRC